MSLYWGLIYIFTIYLLVNFGFFASMEPKFINDNKANDYDNGIDNPKISHNKWTGQVKYNGSSRKWLSKYYFVASIQPKIIYHFNEYGNEFFSLFYEKNRPTWWGAQKCAIDICWLADWLASSTAIDWWPTNNHGEIW